MSASRRPSDPTAAEQLHSLRLELAAARQEIRQLVGLVDAEVERIARGTTDAHRGVARARMSLHRIQALLDDLHEPLPEPPHPAPHIVPARRARVLVVEDETLLADMLKQALGKRYDVTVASTGGQALALLGSERSYDAVLCDLNLPDINGAEVHAHLRQVDPELARRFLVLTGGFLEGCLPPPGVPLLRKPFGLGQLRQALTQILGGGGDDLPPS